MLRKPAQTIFIELMSLIDVGILYDLVSNLFPKNVSLRQHTKNEFFSKLLAPVSKPLILAKFAKNMYFEKTYALEIIFFNIENQPQLWLKISENQLY